MVYDAGINPGGHTAINALDIVLGGEYDDERLIKYMSTMKIAITTNNLFIYIYLRI